MGLGETVHIQFSFLEACQMLGGTPTAATAACGAAGAARAVMPDPLPSERSDTQGLQIPAGDGCWETCTEQSGKDNDFVLC